MRSEKERHNKFQVLKCPWCGTKMVKDDRDSKLVGEWGYSMGSGKHFYMFCPQEDCDFTNKLPIQIIDDELYRNPPTLLFGTVDKFAMMPWDGRIGAFFGTGSNNRAPELIIQDELHLISGALGTVVGLYETAVDGICSQKGFIPKLLLLRQQSGEQKNNALYYIIGKWYSSLPPDWMPRIPFLHEKQPLITKRESTEESISALCHPEKQKR